MKPGMKKTRKMSKINDVHADVFAGLDEVAEDNEKFTRNRFLKLLEYPKERDLQLWKSIGVDQSIFEATASSIEQASGGVHDLAYTLTLAGLWAAVKSQVHIEILQKSLLKEVDSSFRRMSKIASQLGKPELKAAAKEGTQKAQFATAKENRKNAKAGKSRADS